MAMVVKNNMTAVNTLNILNKNSSALSKSLQKVSSGMKINSAADDASGYAISERMRVQIRSLDQANQNTQNASSMMKVAEGGVSSTEEILKTLKEKAVNAANDSNTDSDRQTIQKELDQSIDQINDNANVTFNGKYLVDGSKNTIGKATYTALSNQSLSEDTKATTKLTDLAARNGDSLEIHETDKVTVSYVQAGKTYTTTFQVKDEKTGKVATLQDIFNKAEEIDETSNIFANAANKSIQEAQKKDGVPVSTLDDATAQALSEAYTKASKEFNKAESDLGALDDTSSYAGAFKAQIDAYNEAAATLNGLGVKDTKGLQTINVASDITKSGEYLDALVGNTSYKAVATAADTVFANMDAKFTSAATKTTVADIKTEIGNTSDAEKAITAAIDAWSAEGATVDEIKDKLEQVKGAYNDLITAQGNLKSGVVAEGVDKNAAIVASKKYADYHAKDVALDAAKSAYYTQAGPKVLEGKTVGLAASNDTVETASGQKAITITANKDGIAGQISGFNISISDSQGNVKKSANAALDAFEETVRAQNESKDNAISLQVGAKANQSIKVGLTDMRAEALGLQGADGTKLNISTQTKANAAINVLDNAIQKALDQQTTIGSVESRLEYTSSNLTTASENVQASESTIRDADMAKEMTEYTKNNVLLQAAQSMLAQANQSSSNVLSLLQ